MKVTVVQVKVTEDRAQNRENLRNLIGRAVASDHPDLILLPECAPFMSTDHVKQHANAERRDGEYVTLIAGLAKQHGVNICLGTFIEQTDDGHYNTSLTFGRDGRPLGEYRKIHRFDVRLPNGAEVSESKMVNAGRSIEVFDVDGLAVGFAVCYDLRFGELFLNLVAAGASLIALPSAFAALTGADHWEVLIRARAIETQCYVAAPSQVGYIDEGRVQTWGHSMIVDPWGTIVAQVSNREGFASAWIDLKYLEDVRARIPMKAHRVIKDIVDSPRQI